VTAFEIVYVRTNLGLRPGVEQLGEALLDRGLAASIAAVGDIHELAAGPRSAERRGARGMLNVPAMAALAVEQAHVLDSVLDRGHPALVLGGDDSVLFGSLLALARRGTYGLVFLDAHLDFYPPQDSPTGEASDSEVFVAFGGGPPELAELAGAGRRLVQPEHAVLIGHRDAEEVPYPMSLLRETDATVIPLDDVRKVGCVELARRVTRLLAARAVDGYLLHIDADVIDDARMSAVDYRVPGGMAPEELVDFMRTLVAAGPPSIVEATIYNSVLDVDGAAAETLREILVAGLVEG
jgi:arginase